MTDILAEAARRWGIDPTGITLVARRENTVYRAETEAGSFALRLHRVGYRSVPELDSELRWMAMLAEHGLNVPSPRASLGGALIEVIDDTAVDLLSWLPGRMVGKHGALEGIADRTGHMRRLGALLARLHDLSDGWTPPAGFTRPRWDRAGLLGDHPLWGPFWQNSDLRAEERALLLEVKARADAELARIEAQQDFGLIHADAITENVMVEGDALSLIDFDDGGWGYRDFDLATVLMRQLTAPDYPDLRAALLAGYTRRPVGARVLDLFILLRSLTYLGWIIDRRDEPGGLERSARARDTAMPLVLAYMTGGDHG